MEKQVYTVIFSFTKVLRASSQEEAYDKAHSAFCADFDCANCSIIEGASEEDLEFLDEEEDD